MAAGNVKATFKALSLKRLSEDLVSNADQIDNTEFTVGVKDTYLILFFSSGEQVHNFIVVTQIRELRTAITDSRNVCKF